MTARGIKINVVDASAPTYVGLDNLSGADRFDYSNTEVTVCGWMAIKGSKGGGTPGGQIFAYMSVIGTAEFTIIRANDADESSPPNYNEILRYSTNGAPGTGNDVGATGNSVAINENYFYGWTWDSALRQFVFYYVKDGNTINSVSSGTGLDVIGIKDTFRLGANSTTNGSNVEITNVKVWKRKLTSTEIDNERKSLNVVGSSGIYGHWKLPSSSDLTDSSGNGRTLTAVGTITSGSMDPVDIQTPPTTPIKIFLSGH